MSSNPLQFHSAQADPRITLQRSSNRFSARPSSYDEIVLKRGIDQPGSIRSLKYAGAYLNASVHAGVRLPTRVPCQVSNSIRVADIRPYYSVNIPRARIRGAKYTAVDARDTFTWPFSAASQFSWNNIPSMWMGDVSLRYFRRTVTRHE